MNPPPPASLANHEAFSGPQRPWHVGLLAWLPWLILLIGSLVTLGQYRALQERQALLERTRFDIQANEVALGLERKLLSNTDLLRGVSGLFAASEQVDRHEFRAYVDSLELRENYPGITAIGFSQWIAASDYSQHLRTVRAAGQPAYAIRPAGDRPHYSSIVYIEPIDWRNQRAFGFDMYTEPQRQQAMRRAVETGQVSLSQRVTLVQETDQNTQAGFLMYLPIYRKGMPVNDATQRWQALEGWAYSPIRTSDLIRSFLQSDFAALQPHIELRLYAAPQPSPDALLYHNDSTDRPTPTGYTVQREIEVHGVEWSMEMTRLASWPQTDTEGNGLAVLLGGGMLTLTLASLAWVIRRSHLQIGQALRETVLANHQLEQSQAALRLAGTVMDASPLGIFVTDNQRRIVSVNPAFKRITGWPAAQVLGQAPPGLADAETPDLNVWSSVESTGTWEGEIQSRRADGSPYPQRLAITRVSNDAGATEHFVGLFQDITQQRKAEDHIRQLAHHDYLTGLPNRALLVERAGQELQAAARYRRRPVLLFIDLDRFKPINDAHGHEAGDTVLIQVAQRLNALLRETDLVCRQGGDEFVVLLPDHEGLDGLLFLAQKLLNAIETPYELGHLSLNLSASIGIAIYPDHGQTVDQLIQSADTAMYRAKASPDHKVWLAGEDQGAFEASGI